MATKNVLHMNVGDGETSYASHSILQKAVISKALHVLDETLEDMFSDQIGFPKCFKMVDLGCASGPNTLLATSHILDKIRDLCKQNNINDLPEFEVFLNDLPGNDFNNLFKSLPEKRDYFVRGLPGSFYGRLSPSNSLHFAYSSYSIHWLSQVPEGLENKNKENIYIAMTSPPEVYEAYAKQYQRDFGRFLNLRADEIISGGRMVLTFVGRSAEDPSTKDEFSVYTLLAKTLVDMVAEGFVKMDDLYSFNIPMYAPCPQEVEAVIQSEGSFTLDKMQFFHARRTENIDDNDQKNRSIIGKNGADLVRAFAEPMLASHFGSSIIDDLFGRYANKLAEHISRDGRTSFNIVISLSRN